jgi:AcrR family transcriptional regulator
MARPKRRQREIEETKRHILEAAARVLARKTFTAASVQEIADEAGFSAAALYGYFSGKESIIQALAEHIRDETASILQRPLPESLSFKQKLELLLLRQAEWIQSHVDDFLVLAREERFRAALEEAHGGGPVSQVAGLTEWMRTQAGAGELGVATPEEAAYFLWGVMRGAIARWIHGSRPGPITSVVPRMVGLFFHGVLGAAAESQKGVDG